MGVSNAHVYYRNYKRPKSTATEIDGVRTPPVAAGPFSPSRLPEALLSRHRQFGKIFKETIVGRTVVHLFDPDYVRVVYQAEGKIPHIPPLLETTQMYREYRKMSPGLGHTYVRTA